MYSGKSGCIRVKWLYSAEVVVFGQSGYIRVKVFVFWQKWLYSYKNFLFGQNACIREKVVVLG